MLKNFHVILVNDFRNSIFGNTNLKFKFQFVYTTDSYLKFSHYKLEIRIGVGRQRIIEEFSSINIYFLENVDSSTCIL